MAHRWKRVDPTSDPRTRPFLASGDECYYCDDYISGGGYEASPENQRIFNLKKSRKHEKSAAWKHKERAAKDLARDLSQVLPEGATIAFIPSSKQPSDPEFDPRWDMVLTELRKLRPDLVPAAPFHVPKSVGSAHSGNREEAADAIEWAGFGKQAAPAKLWIIDDVLTTGRHFKRCKELLRRNEPTVAVVGVFWARVVDPPTSVDDEEIEF